jgi:hypothetical protein
MPGSRRTAAVSLIVLLALAGEAPVFAGGSFDDDDRSNDQLSFFGFVRDTRGLGVGDARVVGEVKDGPSVVTHTDTLGVYRLPGFSKDTDPGKITISCSKEGYQQIRILQRTTPGPNVTAFEVECTLQRN